jgi:ketosteroid isomerase-like protein
MGDVPSARLAFSRHSAVHVFGLTPRGWRSGPVIGEEIMSPTEFMCAYEAATNAHDLEATLNMIADDAIFLFSNQTSHIGKDAIRKAIQANFNVIKGERYRTSNLTWLVSSEDVAACVYEFDWVGEINGKPAFGDGRGTTVIRRALGNWQIAHEHLSRGRLT